MLAHAIPILGFAAYSGTGKTQLLKHLLPLLNERGLKIGVIKHSHHDFEIDYPGKDSYELRRAGASPMMLASPYRKVLITETLPPKENSLAELLNEFPGSGMDLILVEGFRHEAFAKIELHRPSLGKPLLYPDDDHIIAVASDQRLTVPKHLPCLDLNDSIAIADFIVNDFLETAHG